MDFEGKVAIVTGAASGIGRAVSVALAREGARVGIGDVNLEGARETAREARAQGSSAVALKTDVARKSDIDRLFKQVLDRYGRLDVLVSNAGIAQQKSSLELTEKEWDRLLDINLKGAFFCAQAAARYWVGAKLPGAIVHVTSIGAERSLGGNANYAASKGGLKALTHCLAIEFARYGITVNAIGPGGIPTSIMKNDWSDPEVVNRFVQRIPVGRMGTPEDVANAVLFLASEKARYITGQSLYVDGGRLMLL